MMKLFSEDGTLYRGTCVVILDQLPNGFVKYLFIRESGYMHMSNGQLKYVKSLRGQIIDKRGK
jgi:hypothetical protein